MAEDASSRPVAFPQERAGRMVTPGPLIERGFLLRPVTEADLPWLAELYASTRSEEMAGVPWPDIAKRSFLRQQFELQHRHYVQHFADADFLAVVRTDKSEPAGRYYLQRNPPEHLLVDISLFPQYRNRGLGRMLIEDSQRTAYAQGCGMHLHVLHQNIAARRLYERLGFIRTHDTPTHQHMRWLPREA
ncbi:MAG: N-acetyltransferase [Lysobacteraceae bacterium]|nr:MAG: N-acetyltransferase [Xanthomonadaceae bacterium]